MRRPPTLPHTLTVAIATTFLFGASAVVAPTAVADPSSRAVGNVVPLIGPEETATTVNGFEGASDMDVAEDGTVYVADEFAGQVFTVSPDGSTDVVAGSGTVVVDGGDGEPAVDAYLELPAAVALGADGTLYIADRGDYTVRAVDGAGEIRTVYSADWDEDVAGTRVSLAAADDGVYVGIPEEGVWHVDQDDEAEQAVEPREFPGDEVARGLDVAEDGTLYVATGREVYTEASGALSPALSGGNPGNGYARDVAVGDGAVYIAGKYGLLVHDGADLDVHTALNSRHVALSEESLYLIDGFARETGDEEIRTTVWQTPVDDAAPNPPSPGVSNDAGTTGQADEDELESYSSGTLLSGPIDVEASRDRSGALAAGPDGSLVVASGSAFVRGQSSAETTSPHRRWYPHVGTYVDDVEISDDGSFVYRTDNGLHQLFPDGSMSLLTEQGVGIRAFTLGDGVVYAATRDAVFTVEEGTELVPFVDLGEQYDEERTIGDLAVAADGSLIMLDIEQRALLHVDADGAPLFETDLSQLDQGTFSAAHMAVAPGEEAEIYVAGKLERDGASVSDGVIVRLTGDGEGRGPAEVIAGLNSDIDAESPPVPAQTVVLDLPHSLSVDSAGNLHFFDDGHTYMIRDAAGAPSEAQKRRNTILGMSLAVLLALGVAAGVLRYIAVRQREMANMANSAEA